MRLTHSVLTTPFCVAALVAAVVSLSACGDRSVTEPLPQTHTTTDAKSSIQSSASSPASSQQPLTAAMANDYVKVVESLAGASLSPLDRQYALEKLSAQMETDSETTLTTLQQYSRLAATLGSQANAQQRQQLLDELFSNLTQATVIEYLAPEGAQALPTDPFNLVLLAQQRLGDFSRVIADLKNKGDIRGFIFTNRRPLADDIENTILALHDIALSNEIASSGSNGAMTVSQPN